MLGNIFEVIVGLLLLIWGADRFVHGAAATARNLGVPPLLIGLTIVALATSAPEILISLVAALRGEPHLAIGNAIGSNIANIGLVLGVTAILRPIELKSATLRREMPALLAVTLLTVSLFLDSYLSRVDGLALRCRKANNAGSRKVALSPGFGTSRQFSCLESSRPSRKE